MIQITLVGSHVEVQPMTTATGEPGKCVVIKDGNLRNTPNGVEGDIVIVLPLTQEGAGEIAQGLTGGIIIPQNGIAQEAINLG
jgi:hypothetical protein